jgi:O-antigen/teichoic acid export membrane protein
MTIEKIGHAMKWSLIARIAAFAAGLAANILIVRALSEHDWGVYSEIRTLLQFVLVFVMIGVDAAILKFAPMLRIRGGARIFSKTFRSLIVLQVGVWLCILLVSRFGYGFFNAFFKDETGQFSFFLQVAILCFIFELFMLLVTRLFESWYETKRVAAVVVWGNIIYFGGIALAFRLHLGIPGVFLAGAVMNLFMVALLAPKAVQLIRSVPSEGTGPGIGAVLRFSLPFVVTGLLNQIVWRQSEVLLLGHFKGAEAAGFFSLAYRLPQQLLEFVPLTVWPIVMAGMSEAYAKDARNLPRAVYLYFKLIFLLVVPVASLGFAFARPLIPIIYGVKMLPAALLTQLFFVVFSYSFLYTPMSMAFFVMGKSWINMLIFLSVAIIEIGLDCALIPRYGMWGAMVPVSFALVLAVILFHSVMRKVRRDVTMPSGFVVRCSLAGIPTCLLSILSSRWSSPTSVALMVPAGIVLLFLGFRALKVIGTEEKELILRMPIPGKERLVALF